MRLRFPLALATAVVLLATGCGESADPAAVDSGSEFPGYPVTVGDLTLTAQPTSIVSLSPTVTEMLFAVGAGDQVIAAEEYSNYPPDAPTTDLSGFIPNVEAIAGYQPDLVIISSGADEIVPQLTALDIPVHVAPDTAVTLDDVYQQLIDLGGLTGHPDQARELVEQMSEEITKLVADLPARDAPLTYYYELDDQLYTVTSQTFVGTLFTMVGLANIADAHDSDQTGYLQLSAEIVVDANPDMIFLADTKCCGQTAQTVAARDGWAEIEAVRTGQIVELDDDIASRWGPRIVDLLREIVDAVSQAG